MAFTQFFLTITSSGVPKRADFREGSVKSRAVAKFVEIAHASQVIKRPSAACRCRIQGLEAGVAITGGKLGLHKSQQGRAIDSVR